MIKQQRNQQGFTLIELMIVIAIIGILAAVALPAYQDYTARAQASEALTSTAGVRADIGVAYAEDAALPAAGDDAVVDANLAALEGKYFAAGGAVLTGAGVISVTFNDGVHNGDTMTMTAIPNLAATQIAEWQCGGLDVKYLPSGCRP
jgi:type IV pilus assembly protein PilA